MDVAAVSNLVAGVVLLGLLGVLTYRGVRTYRRVRRLVRRAAAVAGSAQWWTMQPLRRQMWRAVSGARTAVDVAVARQVPVGDLPSVTRQLQAAAAQVDAALRAAAAAGHVPPALRSQAQQVTRAAADVTATVTSAMTADSAPQVASLLDAVRLEVRALGH
jgi:hypothetical protein